MGEKLFCALDEPPASFVQKDENFRTNSHDHRLQRHKFTSYQYAGALVKWLFLVNRPTRLQPEFITQFILCNDLYRTCSMMPVAALNCGKRDTEGLLACKKCTLRNSVLDCHDLVTSMYLVFLFWYLLYIAKNRVEVQKLILIQLDLF